MHVSFLTLWRWVYDCVLWRVVLHCDALAFWHFAVAYEFNLYPLSLSEIGEDIYRQWFATRDHGISRIVYAKLQFKIICTVAVDCFMKILRVHRYSFFPHIQSYKWVCKRKINNFKNVKKAHKKLTCSLSFQNDCPG